MMKDPKWNPADSESSAAGDLIESIMRHLDGETRAGVARMSVEMDDSDRNPVVSHKCCNMYGRPANETVGLLDCYTDRSAGEPDNERR